MRGKTELGLVLQDWNGITGSGESMQGSVGFGMAGEARSVKDRIVPVRTIGHGMEGTASRGKVMSVEDCIGMAGRDS